MVGMKLPRGFTKCGLQGIAACVQGRILASRASTASRKCLKHPRVGLVVSAESEARELLQISHMLGAFSRLALLYESAGTVTNSKRVLKSKTNRELVVSWFLTFKSASWGWVRPSACPA